MSCIPIQGGSYPVTSASAIGDVNIVSTADVLPGSVGWLTKDDGSATIRVKVVRVVSGTTLSVKPYDPAAAPTYGRANVAAYTGGGSTLHIEAQVVPVDPSYSKRQSF